MRIKPTWRIAVLVYVVYNAIIFTTWIVNAANYLDMVSRDVILKSLVVPLALGAVFMAIALTWLGWWRPVMIEERRGSPRWTQWVIVLIMLGVITIHLGVAEWSALSWAHLAMLVAAGVLVGFNEESLTRGVLVVGWRGSTPSEAWVWFWSCLLFGLLHLPNIFFGLGIYGMGQVVFAFLAGTGFYVIRRVGGSLLLCMALHGTWDFATFASQASGVEVPEITVLFQMGTYLLSIALVVVVLRADRRDVSAIPSAN